MPEVGLSHSMEREQWHGPDPAFKPDLAVGSEEPSPIPDPTDAEREARTVQSIAEERAESGFFPEPEAAHYEAAARDLELLKEADPELANDIVSASVAEIEFREKIGPARFDLFKQAQKDGLDRAAEEFRRQYRPLLEVREETSSERYDRLRRGVAQITHDLYKQSIREIALDQRLKEACDRDVNLLKEGLRTFDSRLNVVLTRVSDEELNNFYGKK